MRAHERLDRSTRVLADRRRSPAGGQVRIHTLTRSNLGLRSDLPDIRARDGPPHRRPSTFTTTSTTVAVSSGARNATRTFGAGRACECRTAGPAAEPVESQRAATASGSTLPSAFAVGDRSGIGEHLAYTLPAESPRRPKDAAHISTRSRDVARAVALNRSPLRTMPMHHDG